MFFTRIVRGFVLISALLGAPPLFAKTVTLTAADNHSSISLIEGDTLVITLPSPMMDSYRWQALLPKPSPLSALHDDYTPPKDAKGVGTQTFRFNAAVVTDGLLLLRFERQGAGSAPLVTQTFSVDVGVASGEPPSSVLIGYYRGTMACADCMGIRTELHLYAKGKDDFTNTIYVLTRTYLGGRGGTQSFTDRGGWAVMKGDATDANATVYALNPDDPAQAQYMLLQSGGAALTQLDQQMKMSDAPAMYQLTLNRVQ